MRILIALLLTFALTLTAAVPAAPTGLEASDGAYPNRIALSWEHVRDAQIYRVFRNRVNDVSSATSIGITESVTFSDSVSGSESFFYWVRAEGDSGTGPFSAPDQGSSSGGINPFTSVQQ